MTYLDGAYRLHRPEDVARFTQLAKDAFPDFADRIECFGVDWLGRQFATDRDRVSGGMPQVLMLEPGTGEALEIPVNRRISTSVSWLTNQTLWLRFRIIGTG